MIKNSTFKFLEDVAVNNDREWFQVNKSRYEDARANAIDFTREVILGLSVSDPLITTDIEPKDCVLRIYRDIRFSKDKTPYKTNIGIGISQNGKNFKGPGYYIHIHPKTSFITGGCWMPEASLLKSIRQEIDYSSSDFNSIISHPAFIKYYKNLDREDMLKTAPKGYGTDHPYINYLKLKSFTASHDINRKILTGKDAVAYTVGVLRTLFPFMEFLRNAVS
ncbi:MAG TPA: DUF2461 domain-containing protein [Sphingobacteriaceae bacterium]|nr:DUF2461 domain-containing protein [Sphingobacteriaceae bacterium]